MDYDDLKYKLDNEKLIKDKLTEIEVLFESLVRCIESDVSTKTGYNIRRRDTDLFPINHPLLKKWGCCWYGVAHTWGIMVSFKLKSDKMWFGKCFTFRSVWFNSTHPVYFECIQQGDEHIHKFKPQDFDCIIDELTKDVSSFHDAHSFKEIYGE